MKIGFIVGREDEHYDDEWLYSITPKKYLVDGFLNVDVAIAMYVKLFYSDINVDIIKPNELSIKRLKKNYVNFPLGYDIINANIGSPYIKKFSNNRGYNNLLNIYKSKSSKIFPPYSHLEFIWNKDKYMKFFKNKIPINPSLYITSKTKIQEIITNIKKKKWRTFIIKPIGASTADGFIKLSLNNNLYNDLESYFNDYYYYSKFIIQEYIKGFKNNGEIRIFWIDNKYSYAINTIDKTEDNGEYIVNPVKNKKELSKCISLGENIINNIPPIIINKHRINPVMIRTDFACCLNNKPKKSLQYYLNEIEYQDAGTFTNFDTIQYPIAPILADSFVKKAYELKKIKF